jgi:hypothetical protein
MKPTTQDIRVQSTVGGEAVKMRIDDEATGHIMDLLTNAYRNPVWAVVREYAANAADAHAAAKQTRPIEVTTPKPLRPTFTVRDYGDGLSAEDIRRVYSAYGASTKRDSDEFVGMMGIGCKCALAYCDAFTLVGIRDGIKTTVSVARDEDGAGSMTILSEEPTTEDSGVEVSVPARGTDNFHAWCEHLFAFWPWYSVLLDGAEPKRFEGYALSDELTLIADDDERLTEFANVFVVMGDVPYPVECPEGMRIPTGKTLIARVPIGAVKPTPSREGLMDTARTRKAIDGLIASYTRARRTIIQKRVTEATDKATALRAYGEAAEAIGWYADGVTWRGDELPQRIKPRENECSVKPRRSFVESTERFTIVPARRSYEPINKCAVEHELTTEQAVRAVWITGFEFSTWNAPQRRKLDRYVQAMQLRESGQRTNYVLLRAKDLPGDGWLSVCDTIAWEDVRKWRDPNAAIDARGGGGVRSAGTYDTMLPDTEFVRKRVGATLIPANKPIYYVETSSGYYRGAVQPSRARSALRAAGCRPHSIVVVPQTRLAKFLRAFPKARPAGEACTKAARRWWSRRTPAEREMLARRANLSYEVRYALDCASVLDPDAVLDPEVATAARLARKQSVTLQERYDALSRFLKPGHLPEVSGELTDWRERYPLLRNADESTSGEDATLYINAAYAARPKETA